MSKKKQIPKILKEIKNYKPLVMDYSFQKSISYSAFSTFSSCKHKWELMYQKGHYKSDYNINLCFGTAIHNTLQNYLTVNYEVSGVEADQINLEEYFQNQFTEAYQKSYKDNGNKHFSNPIEMREFYEDGVNILNFIKKNKLKYFSKKDWYLVGVEIPVLIPPYPRFKNVIFKGFIDLVLYHEPTNKFVIYDLKSSSRGWSDKEKKDETKIAQILLYKHYFSKQFNIPIENIDVEFFIMKRKIPKSTDFPIYHIQQFKPASGKNKVTKAVENLEKFIQDVFDEKGLKDKQYEATPSDWNCRYCVFKTDKSLCSVGINK